jgi:hypothetical protein
MPPASINRVRSATTNIIERYSYFGNEVQDRTRKYSDKDYTHLLVQFGSAKGILVETASSSGFLLLREDRGHRQDPSAKVGLGGDISSSVAVGNTSPSGQWMAILCEALSGEAVVRRILVIVGVIRSSTQKEGRQQGRFGAAGEESWSLASRVLAWLEEASLWEYTLACTDLKFIMRHTNNFCLWL